MSISSSYVVSSISREIKWLNARQSVIAENIANNDTPRYKARDLKPLAFRDVVNNGFSVNVKQTNAKHFGTGGAQELSGGFRIYEKKPTAEVTPDGNSVNLEQQLVTMSEIQERHKLMLSLTRKYRAMHRHALGQ